MKVDSVSAASSQVRCPVSRACSMSTPRVARLVLNESRWGAVEMTTSGSPTVNPIARNSATASDRNDSFS
jgi:hypothetical protein